MRILVLEDNPDDFLLIQKRLLEVPGAEAEFTLEHVSYLKEAKERLRKGGIDLILSDLQLPDSQRAETVLELVKEAPEIPVVALTGTYLEEQMALEAIRGGAQDHLAKEGLDGKTLVRTIQYAVERMHLQRELVKLSQMKEEFVSTVSHEIRTPLGILQETISLLSDGTLGPVKGEQKEYLGLAQSNIERLSRLINDILDYQKLDGGFEEFHKTPEDLNQIIREVSKGFAAAATKKGLRLKTRLAEKLPSTHCDRDKITQVLTNFLSNALKFTEKGEITVASERGENWVKVSVRDEGPGVAKVDQAKLFQSFSQLKMSGARKPGGTGLGLAISRKIIESHGGRIGVESTPGKDATFYFILPIQDRRVS